MTARQYVPVSHPRPPAGKAAHATASPPQTAAWPASTLIAPPQADDPHAALAIDRWNNEGGRIYDGRPISDGAAQHHAGRGATLAERLVLTGAEHGFPREGVAAVQRSAT
jgi:hypothetical protein